MDEGNRQEDREVDFLTIRIKPAREERKCCYRIFRTLKLARLACPARLLTFRSRPETRNADVCFWQMADL